MGLFDSIKSYASAVKANVPASIQTVKDILTPSAKVSSGNAIVDKIANTPLIKQIVTPLPTATKAVVAGTILLGSVPGAAATAAGGTLKVAQTVGAYAIKNPIGALIYGTVGTVGAGILSKTPEAKDKVMDAPKNAYNFGTNIGEAIHNPSIENITTIAKENPFLTALSLAGAGLLISKASSTAAQIANTDAIGKNNEIMAKGASDTQQEIKKALKEQQSDINQALQKQNYYLSEAVRQQNETIMAALAANTPTPVMAAAPFSAPAISPAAATTVSPSIPASAPQTNKKKAKKKAKAKPKKKKAKPKPKKKKAKKKAKKKKG